MNRITRKKIRLKYILKAYKNNKWIHIITAQKKSTIHSILQANTANKWHIYIGYGKYNKDHEICNEGIYKTKKEVIEFLKIMTEYQLLDFIEKG